jgi:hypothetical protein
MGSVGQRVIPQDAQGESVLGCRAHSEDQCSWLVRKLQVATVKNSKA